MNRRKWDAGAIARLGILTAVALVLGYVESLFPIAAVPGVKLGLSNTVLLYALFLMDAPSALLLMLLKVGLSGLLFGGPTAMLYSLAGGILSLAAMLLMRRARGVGVVGVSVLGAAAHNIGQTLVACAVVGVRAALAYLPVLLLAAAAAGVLTGIIAKAVMKSFSHQPARCEKPEQKPAETPAGKDET